MLTTENLLSNKKFACREVCGLRALRHLPERKGIKGSPATEILVKGRVKVGEGKGEGAEGKDCSSVALKLLHRSDVPRCPLCLCPMVSVNGLHWVCHVRATKEGKAPKSWLLWEPCVRPSQHSDLIIVLTMVTIMLAAQQLAAFCMSALLPHKILLHCICNYLLQILHNTTSTAEHYIALVPPFVGKKLQTEDTQVPSGGHIAPNLFSPTSLIL